MAPLAGLHLVAPGVTPLVLLRRIIHKSTDVRGYCHPDGSLSASAATAQFSFGVLPAVWPWLRPARRYQARFGNTVSLRVDPSHSRAVPPDDAGLPGPRDGSGSIRPDLCHVPATSVRSSIRTSGFHDLRGWARFQQTSFIGHGVRSQRVAPSQLGRHCRAVQHAALTARPTRDGPGLSHPRRTAVRARQSR